MDKGWGEGGEGERNSFYCLHVLPIFVKYDSNLFDH